MNGLKKLLVGFIIGGGLILPGVSGGVIAVILDVYDKIIKAVSHFFDDWKKNLIFLFPIVLGIILGIFIFGNVLAFVFDKYPREAKFIFIGLIIGGLPLLFHKITTEGTKTFNIKAFIIALIIAFVLFILGNNASYTKLSENIDSNFTSYLILFLAGIIYVSGKIIPGISGSFLLMLIGMYEYVLNVIASFFNLTLVEYLHLIPFFLGIIFGGFLLVKIIEYLLNEYYNISYSAILGFIIGSLPALYPGLSLNINGLINIILLVLAFLIAYTFSTKKIKNIKEV